MRCATLVLLVCSFVVIGCARTAEHPSPTPPATASALVMESRADEVADSYSLRAGKDALRSVRAALASGQDPLVACAVVATCADELRPSAKAEAATFVREADRTCGFEAPLKWAEHNIQRIHQQRMADPQAMSINECAQLGQAIENVQSAGAAADAIRALEAKRTELCGA